MIPGFKEWMLICEAVGSGAQSLIIRKGGIAEGRQGFRFQYGEFLLFPTRFHEQAAKLKLPSDTPLPEPRPDGQHAITLRARVDWTRDITDLEIVRRLAPFHIWTDAEIERRFHYDEENGKSGVSVAFVRIDRFAEPFVFPDSPKYGGCRSWVQLPDPPPGIFAAPVLDDATHAAREKEIKSMLG